MKHYVYVLVRKDLPLAQQLVQSTHAALQSAYDFPALPDPWLVVLQVDDQEHLLKAEEYLEENGVETSVFFEPDFDIGYSALATIPIRGKKRRVLRHFETWKE